jgi:hypothetical protein
MSKRRRLPTSQSDLFVIEPAVPEGFVYRDNVITVEEEQALIERFSELPFKPFEFHGFLGNRRVVSFGWRYDFSSAILQPSNPIPPFLFSLRERAAVFANVPSDTLQQVSTHQVRALAGIETRRCSTMSSPYRSERHAPCGSAESKGADGSARPRGSSAFGLSVARPCAARVGAQRSARRSPALFGDVPEFCRGVEKVNTENSDHLLPVVRVTSRWCAIAFSPPCRLAIGAGL